MREEPLRRIEFHRDEFAAHRVIARDSNGSREGALTNLVSRDVADQLLTVLCDVSPHGLIVDEDALLETGSIRVAT